ncbi:MAG: hypothetical protein DI629_01360 [Mesorhizobium amorphae]|nr:MAG: hypothetical protein DI629_01360 [Mesorhizobium amorphae]
MTDPIPTETAERAQAPATTAFSNGISRSKAALAGAGMLALGLVAGGASMLFLAPADRAALASPVAISAMTDGDTVAIKGQVAEVFGNKFVLADASGRTLVDTGKRGEDATLVEPSQQITVQGRYDHGFVKGEILVRADGTAQSLKPPKPGPRGWVERLNGGTIEVARAPDAP